MILVYCGSPLLAQRLQFLLHKQRAAKRQTGVIFDIPGRIPHGEDGVSNILDERAMAARDRGRANVGQSLN